MCLLFILQICSFRDIDAIKRNPIRYGEGSNQMFNFTSMAAIKRKEWEYEHECRMIATLLTVLDNVEAPDIDYILVPIKFDHIKKLEITFNPWMEQHTKEEIKQFVYSISGFSKEQICFHNSILTGEIRVFKIKKKSYFLKSR